MNENLYNIVIHSMLFKFIAYSLLIILLGLSFKGTALYASAKNSALNERFTPVFLSSVNWLMYYSIILLFLFIFSKKKWLFYPLYSQGGVKVTLFLVIIAIMLVSLASRLVKLLTRYILTPVYKHYDVDKGLGFTFNQVIYYVVMLLAVWISFKSVGIDLTALGTVFSVLGIGIGFGMRNIAGNFVSGIIMLFERPVEVGEVIQIDDTVGKVEKIRLRSTLVRSAKEGALIVPNQYFIEQVIKNRTGAEVTAQVMISVEYGADTKEVELLLYKAVKKVKDEQAGILKALDTSIRLINIRGSAIDFLIELPVMNLDVKDEIESRLRHSIVKLFMEKQIRLATYVASQPMVKE
ncbi:mechanosensitive ion channel family protein [Heyndrickxia acidicola]|uniref:Mechanosensitive ion channel n=1 Tax=Heyndrickxia acidicola TaxID=209389 RepID=A0ABU6MA03_9BACI|nr:mechanosensitive ion channel domain-containing protein [Heyndrickxia acidicola]MED1201507.1 mechanosensitive ion channel [Heyndrickxia acidicola]